MGNTELIYHNQVYLDLHLALRISWGCVQTDSIYCMTGGTLGSATGVTEVRLIRTWYQSHNKQGIYQRN